MNKIEQEDLFDKLMDLAAEFNFEFVMSPEDVMEDKKIEYFIISLLDKQIIVK